MKKEAIEKAALDVFVAEVGRLRGRGEGADVASSTATALAKFALADLSWLVSETNKAAASRRVTATKGTDDDAELLLLLYQKTFPRFTQPQLPIEKKSALWKRLKECGSEGLEVWKKRFALVFKSEFLMGKSNHYQATLPWLLNEKNIEKLEAGAYP